MCLGVGVESVRAGYHSDEKSATLTLGCKFQKRTSGKSCYWLPACLIVGSETQPPDGVVGHVCFACRLRAGFALMRLLDQKKDTLTYKMTRALDQGCRAV